MATKQQLELPPFPSLPLSLTPSLLPTPPPSIRKLQKAQSDIDNAIDIFTNSETQSQTLCDHLDHILMHGVREFENGYWPFVSYFTRNELVQSISDLKQVTTNVGKGTCTYISHPRQLIFRRKSDCLGCAVLLCLVCLFDLACFFLPSFSYIIKFCCCF